VNRDRAMRMPVSIKFDHHLLFITIEKYVIYRLSFSCKMSKTQIKCIEIPRIKIQVAYIYVSYLLIYTILVPTL